MISLQALVAGLAGLGIAAILLQQDLANIEAGIYPLPADHDGSPVTLLHRSRLFFEDLPRNPSTSRAEWFSTP